MLRTHRSQHSGAALAGLIALVGTSLLPFSASGAPTDATLTVIVNRDVDHDGSYSSDVDRPQPGIEIVVTDARGKDLRGVTDRDGRFVLRANPKLQGGRYFVMAKIPDELAELSPVPVYVRAHQMLNTDEGPPSAFKWGSTNAYTEDAAGNPVYNWTVVDRIVDTWVSRGMKPLMEWSSENLLALSAPEAEVQRLGVEMLNPVAKRVDRLYIVIGLADTKMAEIKQDAEMIASKTITKERHKLQVHP